MRRSEKWALASRQLDKFLGIEFRHHERARAANQARQEERSRRMRDRGCMQKRVGWANVWREVGQECGKLGEFSAHCERDALGPPGRAASIAEAIRRVQIPIDRARTCGT